MVEPEYPELSRVLREAIDRAGMTQQQVADRIGVTQAMISAWATGKKRPNSANCDRLAVALGLDVDALLTAAGHRPRLVTDEDDEVRHMLEMIRRLPSSEYEGIREYLQWRFDRAKRRRSGLPHN